MRGLVQRFVTHRARPSRIGLEPAQVYDRLCDARRARHESIEAELATLLFSRIRLESLVFERRAEIARLHTGGLVAKRAGHLRKAAAIDAEKLAELSLLGELEGELSDTRREVEEAKRLLAEHRRQLRALDIERTRNLGQLRRARSRHRLESLSRERSSEIESLEEARTETQRRVAEAELEREMAGLSGQSDSP